MGYLYRKITSVILHEGKRHDAFMSINGNNQMDALFKEGKILREDIDTAPIVSGEAIPPFRLLKKDVGKAKLMEAPGTDFIGVSVNSAPGDGNPLVFVKGGPVAVEVGADIADNEFVVAAPGGVIVPFVVNDHSLMSAVVGAATGDFDNSVWSTGKVASLATSIDSIYDRSQKITLHFIGIDGLYTTEVVTLNNKDSSANVSSVAKIKRLLAVSVGTGGINGTLVIKGETNICISLTAPGAGVYGQVLPDDSTDAKGQRVKLSSGSGSVTGFILVVGTDSNGAAQTELVEFSAEANVYTSKAWKTVTALYIGDDGIATCSWSVQVDKNTESQKIGKATFGALKANTVGPLTLLTSFGNETIPIAFAGIQGAITANQENFIGPVDNEQNTSEDIFFVVPVAGVLSGLFATLEVAPGGSDVLELVVRVNKKDTDLSVSIEGDAIAANSDYEEEIPVERGDKVSIKAYSSMATGWSASGLNVTIGYRPSN